LVKDYVPAMTSVFPVNGTLAEKIQFLKRQVSELEQQKKCYDKMIRDRKKTIKQLQKHIGFIDVIPMVFKCPVKKKRPRKRK